MPDNEVNAARFDVPASPTRNIYQIERFLGCDFTSSPSAIDALHSSDCINMIRYQPGKVRKRMGYTPVIKGTGTVHAIWKWDNDNYIVHVGTKMYHIGRDNNGNLDFSVISTNTDTSFSQVLMLQQKSLPETDFVAPDKKLNFNRSGDEAIIFGSGVIYFYSPKNGIYNHVYDTNSYTLTVPIITISKKPNGGGTSYQPFNLINKYFTESFYVSSADVDEHGKCSEFHMSFKDLDGAGKVEVLNSSGEWEERLNTTYSVDFTNGIVTFNLFPPGVSPVEGEDNVRITVQKVFSGYSNRIANCTFAIAYGVNGNYDRLFMSGNPDYPNYDWFSEMNDITYFPDTNYSVLGSDATPIKGYAVVSNTLVTLKGEGNDRQIAFLRTGTLDSNGNAIFTVIKSLQGYAILAPDSSIMAGIEPMFLTREGIMAITQADITGEQMMNSRSFYLNGKLLKESHLEKAFAIRYRDYYMLFVNNHVYILDTLQPISAEGAPYSTRQYATFYWENIPAKCAATIDENIYFGTSDGYIMKFYTDEDALGSYNDNGDAIYCRYDTADIDEITFFKVKTYRYFALRLFPAIATSVKIYAYKNGGWELLKDDNATARYFTFSQLVFSKLTFRTDTGTRIITSKIRIKKTDHIKFRIENDEKNEPLMLDQFGIEYTQSNNVKN